MKRGIAVELKDLPRLPNTRELRTADKDVSAAGRARVSQVRDLPDGAGASPTTRVGRFDSSASLPTARPVR